MYSIEFKPRAQKVYNKLDPSVKRQVSEALERRALNPHISGARLSGNLSGHYKIKLKRLGLRVIYSVEDERLLILVLAVGKRENNEIYNLYEED